MSAGRPFRVTIVIGTRPEAIKLAPLVLAFRDDPRFACRVCVTGQHREMLRDALDAFSIAPDADFRLMRRDQTLASLTSRLLERMDAELAAFPPDLLLVQGDTTSVLCGSLAAFDRHIPLGHVEAGLRTGDLEAPWPEEANRQIASRLASLHFAPTQGARENLLREGVADTRILVTGNTVIDALHLALRRVAQRPPRVAGLPAALLRTAGPRMVLITGHRRENFGRPVEEICRAIAALADRFPDVAFVYPVHLNPNVRAPVAAVLGGQGAPRPNVHLIEPLGYLAFVRLMQRSTLILTDSGGIQEEAPSLGKPVLVMRDATERPEAVAAGTVRLVGTQSARILDEVTRLLTDEAAFRAMASAHNPYGDGLATARIVEACHRHLSQAAAPA